MVAKKELTDAQIEHAIEHSEFGDDVVKSNTCVALVASQGWCPQWKAMQFWLSDLEKDEELKDLDLDMYCFVYSDSDYFEDFMQMKETKWENHLIPYVRYYKNGTLIETSNFVSKETFLGYFNHQGAAK